VLDLPLKRVITLIAGSQRRVTCEEAEQWRRLHAEGVTIRAIARATGRSPETVADIARGRRGACSVVVPPRAPAKRPRTLIRGQCARHVRTFHDLGYQPGRIATFLSLDVSTVNDFLARLEPLRRCRVKPDSRAKPRGPEEERQARLARQRASERRQRPEDNQIVDEQRQRLALHRSTFDAWGPRGTAAVIADHTRLLAAVREGRVSGAELLELAARAHYGEPRLRDDVQQPEPVIWTGAPDRDLGARPKLTAGQILEATDLLYRGEPWPSVARRFGVSENTLRRNITGINPRRVAAQYPTDAVQYGHGIVRWDLPLEVARDGTHRTVLVECECGRERRVWTSEIMHPRTRFTGMCDRCHRPFAGRLTRPSEH
jgi:hypothetical protein